MNNIIATALIFVSIALASYSTTIYFSPKQSSVEPKVALVTTWANDVETLRKKSKIDKLWKQIKISDLKAGDELAKTWIPSSVPRLQENPKGKYKLETIVLAWEDEENEGQQIIAPADQMVEALV